MSWQHQVKCRVHAASHCDCEPFMKIDEWLLVSDAGQDLGIVQRFDEEGPYYGNSEHGRTGAMGDILRCQAEVEKMVETGRAPHERDDL